MIFKLKSNTLELKDFDKKQGVVTFYFANFGSKDSDNDIILEGAYKKTIQENFKRIKHLKNHDQTQTPGRILEIAEDQHGAYAVSQLAMTTLGRDTLIEYEMGIITEHSQGFNIIKDEFNNMDGANFIKEVRLWEVSSLNAWGANEYTPMVDLKSEKDVIEMLKKINKILVSTPISDEKAKALESEYAKLSKFMQSLEKPIEPSNDIQSESTPKREDFSELLKSFTNNLKF